MRPVCIGGPIFCRGFLQAKFWPHEQRVIGGRDNVAVVFALAIPDRDNLVGVGRINAQSDVDIVACERLCEAIPYAFENFDPPAWPRLQNAVGNTKHAILATAPTRMVPLARQRKHPV